MANGSQKLTADTAAKVINDSVAPGVTFNGFDGLKQPSMPVKKPLPPDLERSLGINQSTPK